MGSVELQLRGSQISDLLYSCFEIIADHRQDFDEPSNASSHLEVAVAKTRERRIIDELQGLCQTCFER
jgi:hypothetical protein